MESLTKLESAAKECLRDLKSIESKVSATEGNLSFLEAKKVTVAAELADLEAKKAAIQESINTSEREAKNQIEARVRELGAKETQLNSERGALKTKIFQVEAAEKDMRESKEKFDRLYAEYQGKLAELNEKKLAVANLLK